MGLPRHKSITAIVLTGVLLATSISACGGGDQTTASSSTGGTVAAEAGGGSGRAAPSEAESSKSKKAGPVEAKRNEARERVEAEKARYGSPSKRSAPFSRYSHLAKPHLHLAEFGDEAEEGDRAEVQETLVGYLAAVQASEWDAACSYLIRESEAQLSAMAAEDGGAGSCEEGLPQALSDFHGSKHPEPRSAPDGVASLRIQTGDRFGEGAGFALFQGNDGTDYWITVKREGGEWKLLSTAPQRFE
jgi:hypothetical protein